MIRQIYLYSICLISVTVGAIHVGVLVYDFFEYSAPETMMTRQIDTNPTESQYRNYLRSFKDQPNELIPSKEDYVAERKLEYKRAIAKEQRDALQSAIRAMITILICTALFSFHWKYAREQRHDA